MSRQESLSALRSLVPVLSPDVARDVQRVIEQDDERQRAALASQACDELRSRLLRTTA